MARKDAADEHDRWMRRQAVQIVAQLPENEADALKVLEHARRLVTQFLGDDGAPWEARSLRLVTPYDEKASS